jgi:protein NUD1
MAACGNGMVSVLGSIRETTHDGNDGSGVLAERSFSDLNIPHQRGPNPPLKLVDGERGRALSRAASISSTRTTLNHTLQRKTQSSSPQKDRRYHETPEWKRRLLGADVGYGEQRDLFSPMGLENIFRPPPPQRPLVVGKQEEVSYMPSSPPPYPSHIRQNAIDSSQMDEHKYVGGNKLGPLDEEEEDGMASRNNPETRKASNTNEHNEPEQTPTRQAGESSSFNPIATSTWHKNREKQRPLAFHMLHGGDNERPPVTAYRLESKADKSDNGILQGEEQRSVCGQDEEMNEEISPIFISRHNTVDGRIGYAAFSSPNRNTRRKPADLVTPDSDGSVKDSPTLSGPKNAKRFILSDTDSHGGSTSQIFPDDLSTGTQDFVTKGGFIGVRRGGYSDEGSFQQRNLSPSSMHPADASQLARDESCEFSSGDELPQIRRLRPSIDKSPAPLPAAPTPPVAPTTPTHAPRHKDGEIVGASKSSGSPLKLFGNYDTFTNEKLLRRMSQLEDSFLEDESNDDNDISRTDRAGETDEASLGYPGPHTILREDQAHAIRNSSFGVGELDNYEFREQSFASSQPNDYDEDRENRPPLLELKPGVHTSFPLLPSPLTEDNAQAHSRGFKTTAIQTSTTTEERTTRIRTSVNHQSMEIPLRRRLSHSNTHTKLGSGVGENNGRDAPYSPVKDRTPKRRRTLSVQDLDGLVDSEVPKAVTERARHMQSIIGRKRKDARYEKDNNKPVNPDVVAMRQILRPRTPTPSQTKARCRQATRKSPSPRRQAGQHENENGTETNVDVAVGTRAAADEVAVVSIGQPMVNESRKGSVTTQDFLDEALKVMDMIRAKGKPGSGLASVDESEEEGERKLADKQGQTLMGEDSTQEEFERPPSREYNTGPRRKVGIEHDARVMSHLRKYEDTTNMDDITASLNSLNILKAANAVQCAVEAEGDIECDPPNIRITENPSQRKRKHSSSSAQSLHSQPSKPGIQSHGSQSSSASSSTRRTRSIPTGSSTRSETLQVIPPHKVSHLIPGQVAGMVYDQANNLWVKRKNAGDKSESETSEEDPFGGIPDLSVNEAEELERIKLTAEQSRYLLDRTGGSSPPEDQIERVYPKGEEIGYGSPISAREAEDTAETSSTQSKNSRLASSGLQPETRATSWGESPPDDVIQSRQSKGEVHGTHGTHSRDGQNEEVEHEIQVHEDRGEAGSNRSVSGQHRRGLHIAFSSPLVSLRHRDIENPPELMGDIWNDNSPLDNEDSGIDQFLEFEHSSLSLQSSSRRMSFGYAPRSAYRGAARRISIGGRSFSARLFSRIDEQNEESVSPSQRNNATRRASLGVTFSTPMPLRDLPGSSSMPPPATGRRTNVSFHLSPLPDFDLDPVDDAYALEVSYIAQLRGDISLQGIECSFSLATEELVKKLTDVEPYEPYWEHIRQIDLRRKGLITLHMLNDFCPRIEELDVSDNEIGQLSGAPPGIRNLKIANNCLSNLTAWGHLTNLQYLDVSGNEMDNLLGFSGLKHLRELKADDNEIKSLDGIHELDGLISLSVRNNRLEIVDFEKSEL